jgi:hypothetical protein
MAKSVWSNKASVPAPANPICGKNSALCTECAKAKITLTKGRRTCVLTKGKTCPPPPKPNQTPASTPQKPKPGKPESKPTGGCIPGKGKKCKRQTEVATTHEIADSGDVGLVSRANFNIPMDALKLGAWDAGDNIKSNQFSACTFVAIYDRDQYVAAHIPPGWFQQPDVTESAIIAEYLSKMSGALRKNPLSGIKAGYVFYRTSLPAEDLKAIKDMFAAHGVIPRVKSYTYQMGTRGYQIEVSREKEQLTFGPEIKEALMA